MVVGHFEDELPPGHLLIQGMYACVFVLLFLKYDASLRDSAGKSKRNQVKMSNKNIWHFKTSEAILTAVILKMGWKSDKNA